MTLPINRTLPPITEFKTLDDAYTYMKDLIFELQDMYQVMTQNINGFYRNSRDEDGSKFKPTIFGGTTAGTISYTAQLAYVLRTGIMVDFWFYIQWTSIGGGSGDLSVALPYKTTKNGFFTGVLQTGDSLAFPGGRTYPWIQAGSSTYTGTIGCGGNGLDSASVAIQSAGYISGYLRYIGVEDE